MLANQAIQVRRYPSRVVPFLEAISSFNRADSSLLDANMDERRFTYNKDVLWVLDYLSRHGKILKLKLGFCGRRSVRMSPRDGDFLKALKGVKKDKLTIGDPKRELPTPYTVRLSQSLLSLSTWTFFVPKSLVQSMLSPNLTTGYVP